MNLKELWELYYQDKTLENFSIKTLKGYKTQCNLLIRYFGNKDIQKITVFDLKQYLIERGGHLKPSSLGMRIRFIRTFFRYASDEGYIISNPTVKLREPKLGKSIPKALNEEEIEYFREACSSNLEKALTELFFNTGCRVSEIQQLNKEDIDWENRSCIVHGKGCKQREVYFGLKAKILLKWYLNERKDDCSALFVTQRDPHRPTVDTLRRNIKTICKKSNVNKNVTPHTMRHSFATHMLNKGAPLEAVQDQLGHVSIKTTKIYCQLSGIRRKMIHDTYF